MFGVMRDRLTMRSDRVDALEPEASAFEQRLGRVGEEISKKPVEADEFTEQSLCGQIAGGQTMNRRLDPGRMRSLLKSQQPESTRGVAVRPLDQRRIHRVRRRPRHQSNHSHGGRVDRPRPQRAQIGTRFFAFQAT